MYTKCNSSPPGSAPGVSTDPNNRSGLDPCFYDNGPDGRLLTIDNDVATLQYEVSQVASAWPKVPIIIMGHSQGGLIAFDWWLAHGSDSVGKNVTHLFSLDSPINGVCVVSVVCTLGPEGYPNYGFRTLNDPGYLMADAQAEEPFRFLGTWGEQVVGYGTGNDTLQVQLLITGDKCGDGTDNSACPAPPDHISGCPIPAIVGPPWITGSVNYHFVVKWCPDNVNYFNDTLGLTYRPEIRTLDVATSGACSVSATVTVAGVVVGQTGPSFAPSAPNPGPVTVQDLPGPLGDHSLLVAQSEVVNYSVRLAQPVRAISIQASAAGVPPGLLNAVAPPTTYQGPPANVFAGQLTVPFFPGVVAGRIDYRAQVSGDVQCTIGGTVLAPTPALVKAITAAFAMGMLALFLLVLLL